MTRRSLFPVLALAAAPPVQARRLLMRRRVEAWRGSNDWRVVELSEEIDPRRSAVILCDMWDRHWCEGANRRLAPLVERAVPVLDAARRAGFLVIHAPSDTMDFYRGAPQRASAQNLPRVAPPAALDLPEPPLPVESPSGGCDTPEKFFKAWTRQHAGIPVAPDDLVTDRGEEVYSALQARRIERLFIMGVHTNMCILNRSFAIRQMTKWGVRCVLLRDLTDAMYSPADAPRVSHERGTELVIEHIEKYWCPTALAADLRAALPR